MKYKTHWLLTKILYRKIVVILVVNIIVRDPTQYRAKIQNGNSTKSWPSVYTWFINIFPLIFHFRLIFHIWKWHKRSFRKTALFLLSNCVVRDLKTIRDTQIYATQLEFFSKHVQRGLQCCDILVGDIYHITTLVSQKIAEFYLNSSTASSALVGA